MIQYKTLQWLVPTITLSATPVYAYIGPGAGVIYLDTFYIVAAITLTALIFIVSWPIWKLWNKYKHKKHHRHE